MFLSVFRQRINGRIHAIRYNINFAFIKSAYGSRSIDDKDMMPELNREGKALTKVKDFEGTPYVEIGYGIENIFRILSVNMVHRLTHLENKEGFEKPKGWGINVGLRFQF